MMDVNDLKYYVISDITQKYNDINKKIIKFTKLYFYTKKNHSYQITQIENKLNEYNIKGKVKLKQLLENQQNIIKELIKIINNILKDIRNHENNKINENYIPLKKKDLIMSNLNIFDVPINSVTKSNYLNNNTKKKIIINSNEICKNINTNDIIKAHINKSVDDKNNRKLINQKKIISLNVIAPKNRYEFKGTLSFLNMKSSRANNKRKIFGKYINKEKQKIEEKTLKNKNFKSMSISEISNKQKLQNKNNLNLKLNNISNNIKERNPYYINNNYTIDEEKNDNIEKISSINERQNSISSNNINENYGILPHILTKRKKKIKYRVGNGKVLLTDINNKNLSRVKSAKEIAIKNDFYLNYNSSFPNFTITNSSIEKTTEFSYNKRSNSSLSIFNGNLNNIIKENNKALKRFQNELFSYIYNGKKIIPTRYTKEVLNSSYKKLNKYEQKRFQNYEIMFSKK